jgi:predicted RNA-binding Zn-ribbon protein involved in translation (DUF1610 family)
MSVASRTPEGLPNRCPLCGAEVIIPPSVPAGDAPCPKCGHLIWFDNRAARLFAATESRPTNVGAFLDRHRHDIDWNEFRATIAEWSHDELTECVGLLKDDSAWVRALAATVLGLRRHAPAVAALRALARRPAAEGFAGIDVRMARRALEWIRGGPPPL